MENKTNIHDGFGVMDDCDLWDLEDELFTLFQLKEDSDSFCEIHSTGYEEFYLYNREQLKKNNLAGYINSRLSDEIKNIKESKTGVPWMAYIMAKLRMHIVIGFMHLKYQMDIPEPLKSSIIETIDKKINELKVERAYNKRYIVHFEHFKKCIEKEDGEGLTNVGSILPKRTIYE